MNVAVGERQLAQIADQQIDIATRLSRKEWADVDPDRRRAPVAVPQQRTAAAAAEIDDAIVRLGSQERPKHVVPDLAIRETGRQAFVPRIGVQRLIEILRLFGELDPGPEVEIVPRSCCGTAARIPGTPVRRGVPASTPWQSGQRTSDSRVSEIISGSRTIAAKSTSSRSARRSHEYAGAAASAASASRAESARIGEQPLDRGRHRLGIRRAGPAAR